MNITVIGCMAELKDLALTVGLIVLKFIAGCGMMTNNMVHRTKNQFDNLGKGKMTYANGNTYDGDWNNGQIEGIGTFTWANGKVYKGGQKNGKQHGRFDFLILGKGKMIYADGDSYEGDWIEGNLEGSGSFKCSDGRSYVGGFKNHLQHGTLTLIFSIVGKGRMIYADGKTYDGDWIQGKYQGYGTFV